MALRVPTPACPVASTCNFEARLRLGTAVFRMLSEMYQTA